MPKGIPKKKEEVAYKESPEVSLPQIKKKSCKCGHEENMHYGGKDGWCNTKGCQCQYLS